ncbi:MAG: SMC family ATPase, partial [Selenomonadaceae bacterium]|nr:SMC family ATPase [Selenomonadaceae bacterium]
MTPINLNIEAFGPYVKAEIPFKENLGEGKIFLIHGATGAGKTTILDAICYALYGETSGKARDAKDMRSKGVDDKVLTKVEFTFELGDRTYTVKREINYNSKRRDEYQTHAALFCGDKVIETKERAIKTRITELLGFNAEQFRQVVMLPQGEFKKFLAADSAKRQEVLNVLFDSTIYQKIEDALKEKAKAALETQKELELRKETLERQLNGADSMAMAEVEAKFLTAQKKSADLKVIFDAAQAQLSEGKILT